MKKFVFGVSLFICISCTAQGQSGQNLRVNIAHGIIHGVAEGDILVFKGIPYAAPPIGEFRWRPPQPVKPWNGELDASKFSPNCAQGGWGAQPGTVADGSSEDCLCLNIWKPANQINKEKLPVMVWIHGGGFTGGSGSGAQTFGNALSRQGVILVTINYRLGRLGFFAHPALSKEFPEEYKGNYGYMDQIAALEWIQNNISAFGGDPDNVTIFGFSAGGVSVHSLLTIPKAKGLFHKAISESGGGRDGVLTGRPMVKENADIFYKISAETIGVNFAKKQGIEGTDATSLAKLRALRVEQVVDGGQETDGPGGPRTYSGPILDGRLVVETAESAYSAGHQPSVPLIIGNCSAENGGAFVNNTNTKEELFSTFGKWAEEARSAYDAKGDKSFNEVRTKFNTDWVWGEPARMTADAFLQKNAPVYVYEFGYRPESAQPFSPYGAGHGSEVSFVFNTLNARWGPPAEPTATEEELARTLSAYWTNFAKTGDPNGINLPTWSLYDHKTPNILDVELDGTIQSKADLREGRFNVIKKALGLRGEIQSRGI